jgi:predicted permease
VAAVQQESRRVGAALRYRVRAALVVGQLSLGIVLLVGAGLLMQTALATARVDPGFRSEGMVTFRLSIPFQRYRGADAVNDVGRRLQAAVAAVPGVTGVGAISHVPFDDLPNWGGPYVSADRAGDESAPTADYRAVSPGFFETVGARLIEGRFFTEADDGTVGPVVVVDDLLARRAWPSGSAIGKTLTVDPGSSGRASVPATVIGVVEHLRLRSLTEDLSEQVFFAVRQALRNPMAYVVRAEGDPGQVVTAVRQTLAGIDPLLPIYDVRPFDVYTREAGAMGRFAATLAAAFAGAALLLACVGVYGIVMYAVAMRRSEFGLRLALGARPMQVLGLVLREGAALACVGAACGGLAAFAAMRLLAAQLYEVTPTDPVTYGAAALLLALAALASTAVPAWRAAQANPIETLRG